MSAIGAVFCRDGGGPPRGRLAAMSAALRGFGARTVHRRTGPTGLVRTVSAGLAPEDACDPGIVEAGGGRLLLFDGCLHHRQDLAAALGVGQGAARDWADSALFARAWERWGEDSLVRAEGEFAAVVWDPAHYTLTVFCSPLLAPPLFFAIDRRRAIVATAPRAIFAWGDLPRRLDDAYLAGSMALVYGDARASFWRHVRSLAPGETLTVSPDSERIRRHYDLAARVRPVRLPRDSDYLEAANEHLRRAVADAMPPPTASPSVLLSGGLDSTTVAVAALELLEGKPGRAPLVSFTAVPEPGWDGRVPRGQVGDEGPLVRRLQEAYPALDARFVDAAGLGPGHALERMIERAEAPPLSPANQPWLHECLRRSRAAGRRTVLTGQSGNATFSFGGAPRLASLLGAGRWRTLLREAAALPHGRLGPLRPILKLAVPSYLPAWMRPPANARLLRHRHWRRYSAIHPAFARDMRLEETTRQRGLGLYSSVGRSCLEAQVRILQNPIRQGPRRWTSLALAAIHDLALRDPLGDRRLVEWCLGLPDEQYLHRGQSRRLVRRLMRNRLPAEVLAAPFGRQAADRHLRIGRNLHRIRDRFEGWRADPEVAGRLDLDRLLRVLDTWPDRTPLSPADHPEWAFIYNGVERAFATGHFIRWATGAQGRAHRE